MHHANWHICNFIWLYSSFLFFILHYVCNIDWNVEFQCPLHFIYLFIHSGKNTGYIFFLNLYMLHICPVSHQSQWNVKNYNKLLFMYAYLMLELDHDGDAIQSSICLVFYGIGRLLSKATWTLFSPSITSILFPVKR